MRAVQTKAILVAISLGFAASTIAVTAADARERYRVTVCNKTKGKKGTVIGGLTGGTLGAAVAGNGAKTEGAILGGVVGAVAGNQIAKKKKCHYEYRYR
jgi:outer membrane lipoprotein SlyB